jgi:glycine/D-amino acid oxidase-like deaminating enzyme
MHARQTPVGEGRPVWDDTAPPDDLAALDPGPPDALPRTTDVLVVGGGQIGLATAAACTGAGMSVILIERGRLAQGPSGRNGGFLLVDVARSWPDAWRSMSARSFELHKELDARFVSGLRVLDLATRERVLLSAQGHANPLRVAAAYTRAGPRIATRVEAVGVDTQGDRVVVVRTSRGDVAPGVVVFATGCCPPEAGVIQSYLKGHVLATEPARFTLDRMLVDGEVGVAQLADGRLVCGGTKDHDDTAPPVVDATVARLRAAMTSLVPEAGDLEVSHVWSCFRPRVADDFPVIDALPRTANAFFVGGMFSTGLLMAPAVGEIVTEWITTGRAPEAARAFGLSRDGVCA